MACTLRSPDFVFVFRLRRAIVAVRPSGRVIVTAGRALAPRSLLGRSSWGRYRRGNDRSGERVAGLSEENLGQQLPHGGGAQAEVFDTADPDVGDRDVENAPHHVDGRRGKSLTGRLGKRALKGMSDPTHRQRGESQLQRNMPPKKYEMRFNQLILRAVLRRS